MTIELTYVELGVKDCDLTASGETPGEVVTQIVGHLEDEHGIEMPDVDSILKGITTTKEFVEGGFDQEAIMVVKRLREKLGIEPDIALPF
jgi:predicted small metal-binding protein